MVDRVFVVGAGASFEFGLPTGAGLLKELAKLVRYEEGVSSSRYKTTPRLENAFERLAKETRCDLFTVKQTAFWVCRNALLAPSIDNLLHTHSNDKLIVGIGKLLICEAIVEAEKASCLFTDSIAKRRYDFLLEEKTIESWIVQLFWLLVEGSTYEGFLLNLSHTRIITFNYDRCIEHFLFHAAMSYFRLNDSQAQQIRDSIQIEHVYGSLGPLRYSLNDDVAFGNFGDISEAASGIRTFTEADDSDETQTSSWISEAEEIIFLGFGFLDLNLKRLFKNYTGQPAKWISGTAHKLSDSSRVIIEGKISAYLTRTIFKENLIHLGNLNITLQPTTCRDFFSNNYSRLRA